jgi:predicted nucleic acid-binding protein
MSLSASFHRRRCALLTHRIAAVPFGLRNLRDDLEDLGSNFEGAPDLEFRHASKALGLEQSGLGYQRIPSDYRFPYGHTHKEQEEVYVVMGGSGRMKLDDEIVEIKQWDVVRVPPGTWRGYEGGPEGLVEFESANIIRRHELAGIVSADQAAQAHADLLDLAIEPWPYELLAARARELRHNLSSYDASYVALAELIGAMLVTLDGRIGGAPGLRCTITTSPASGS